MHEQVFFVSAQKIRQSGKLPIFLEVYARRIIVYTVYNPLNFLWAPFSLKEPPYLLDYYKLDCRKSANMKIWRLPDRSGSCLIKIRPRPDWSGCCLIKIRQRLIDQAATMVKAGSCLIDQAAARLKSGICLIDQDPSL